MADSLNDLMHAKLAARYPAAPLGPGASLGDLTLKFATDNPTFLRPDGTRTFYSAVDPETLADAAYRYWTAFVP